MNIPDKIYDLLISYSAGEISDEDKILLNKWIEESEGNRNEFRRLLSVCNKTKIAFNNNIPDSHSQWEKISSQLNQSNSYKSLFIRFAQVAVVMVLVVGSYLIWQQTSRVEVEINTIAALGSPGEAKAYLELESGEQYTLGKGDDKTILAASGISVMQDSAGGIRYELKSKELSSEKMKYHTLMVPVGGEYVTTLSDGTKVWVNSASRLKYPTKFKGKDRTVYLYGEAFFKVAHNAEKPFNVVINSSKVQVLGTSFNVSAYKEDKNIEVALLEGKVDFQDRNKESHILNPGFMASLNKKTGNTKVEEVDVESLSAWKDGIFLFNDQRFEDIAIKLKRWYNVEFIFQDSGVKALRFSGAAQKDRNIDYILKVISKTTAVKFKNKGGKILVYR